MIASTGMRYGIVGAGGIASAYAKSFETANNADLVATCDVRPEAADALARSVGCESYSDIGKMCDNSRVEAVVICTPPCTHREISELMMERGVHVLCEKPLAIESADAQAMIEAAERNNVLFTMASKFRYVDDVVKARSLMNSGVLGDIILFENCFTGTVDMSQRWNSDPSISGGGVLIDNGTHSVDIMRYFLGPVVELQVVEGRRIQDLPVEDTVRMFVRTSEGVMGSIDLSWSMSKDTPNYISIYGSQGTIHVGWQDSKYRRNGDAEWVSFGNGYDKFQAFRSQIENFTRAIQGEEPLLIRPSDGLASVEVIEAAYLAMQDHKWHPVSPTTHASGA